jgi:predicted DNA-binding transcriptional regulator AlpA
MNAAELINYKGISQLLGVTIAHTRDRLTKRPDFPAPAVNVSRRIKSWRKADVEKWATVK